MQLPDITSGLVACSQLKVHVVTWLMMPPHRLLLLLLMMMMMNLRCVLPHEVMVKANDLKMCRDDKTTCVSDLGDCGRPSSPSVQTQAVNMSCYYQKWERSVTCELSLESYSVTDPRVSLIFSTKSKVIYCPGLFLPIAVLNITARIKSDVKGTEIRSQPHTVSLNKAVKPPQPVLSVLDSTDRSVTVCWRSARHGSCRLRYRVNNSHVWSTLQPPDFVPVYQDQRLVYTVEDLLPFTIYTAAVACREGTWSDWSRDVTVRTLDRAPSSAPQVCYRAEKTDSGSILLHLVWKDLSFYEAGGRVLGYQVTYEPMKKQHLQNKFILNVTGVMPPLVVEDGACTVTVKAFNAAGYGPEAHLSVDTQRHKSALPPVTQLWVSSVLPVDKGLLLQWKLPSTPPIAYLVVRWISEMRPSTTHTHWTTADAHNTSIVLRDLDPEDSYLISVFTVHQQQCGAPQSLPASVQRGALMEAARLKVAAVTTTSVTIQWVWQRRSGPRVCRYRAVLTKTSHGQKKTASLWPDEQQLTFTKLSPDTEYSLHLLADNVSINIVSVRTEFDQVPVVVTAATLLLLLIAVFITCILSRTVYKSYFFPPISSPRGSTSGQWLMDPNKQQQICSERNILDIRNFHVTEKSVFVVGPISVLSSEELQKEGLLLPLCHLFDQLDSDYVRETQLDTEKLGHRAEEREVNMSLLHQTRLHPKMSHPTTDADGPLAYQISSDPEYLVHSSFQENPEPKGESRRAKSNDMVCDADYISNSCFTPGTANRDGFTG